jgi:hypothetical protein
MKKILVLMLVLGMASLANATLVLTVGGWDTSVVEVTFGYTVTVSIKTDSAISPSVGEGYFFLVGPSGAFGWDVSHATAISTDCFVGTIDHAGATGYPANTDGLYGGVFNFGPSYAAGSTIIDDIQITDLVVGGGVVTLYNVDFDGSTITGVADTLWIHETPEPATLAILGIGALILRRKYSRTRNRGFRD